MSFQPKFDPRLNNRQRAIMMQKQGQLEETMKKFKEAVEVIKKKTYTIITSGAVVTGTVNNQINGVTSINIKGFKNKGLLDAKIPEDVVDGIVIQFSKIFNGILEQQMKEMYEASAPFREMIPEMQKIAEAQNSEEKQEEEQGVPQAVDTAA
jgi:hypothetical protein